ncbi:MAG TPA: prepilin-type N-terminal cleavage/methylation domain-containing protein [Phycisphaerae bacterium]|nr:prepilin-type N-terminal cleavage/methylation domain-containing protein [Phycisphaerae bacterium]
MNRKNEAFTLVEILIVVIILGILAAIVIPQFTSAADDAQNSRLASDRQAVRAQIELFKCEHGYYPGYVAASDSYVAANFVTDLTGTSTGTGGKTCGPYLQDFPTNPFSTSGGDTVVITDDAASTSATNGWYFDIDTKKFEATVTE